MTAFDRIVSALERDRKVTRRREGEARAKCPAHNGDSNDSLAVTETTGQVLVHCHGGCDVRDVLAVLGMTLRDLYDEPHGVTYRYTNSSGDLLRLVHRTPDKTFRQDVIGDGTTFYRLPEVVAAVERGTVVYLTEGEKDADALVSLGVTATTAPMGASNFCKVDASPLKGATVVAVRDRDDAGQRWARDVLAHLDGVASSVTIVESAAGKDAADHVAAGHGVDAFVPVREADAAPVPSRRLVLTPASSITMRPVRWAWDTAPSNAAPAEREGRIPVGSLSLAVGRAGLGKSQFGCWAAARVSTGTLPGAYYGTPHSVVYAASEDSWEMTIAPRLVAAGADITRVYRIDVADHDDPHARLTLPTDTALLAEGIREHDVALVVLDPLLSMVDATVNDYKAHDVRQALEPLVAVADETRVTMLGIAHFTKATGTDPLMLVSGSAAFGQLVRAAVGFARDESDEGEGPSEAFVLSTIKNNLGRESLPSLEYMIRPERVDTVEGDAWVSRLDFTGQHAERSVRDLLRGRLDDDERSERDEAAEWLVDYLTPKGGQAPAGDVIKAGIRDGFTKTTLTRARKRAGVTSDKTSMQGGWLWSLDPNASAEESTKGPKNPALRQVNPSVPSVDPSGSDEAHQASDAPRRCAVPDCIAPARRACVTCVEHAADDRKYASVAP